MYVLRGTMSFIASLAVTFAVTGILWYAKLAGVGMHHSIFFYLLPIAGLAMLYGARPALLSAMTAVLCSMYLFYDPIYTFAISKPLEWGDLICFALLAVIGIKCAIDLARPVPKSRYGRT